MKNFSKWIQKKKNLIQSKIYLKLTNRKIETSSSLRKYIQDSVWLF